jgi:hypothetical protein
MELSLRSAEQIVASAEKDVVSWKRISPAHKFVFASGNTAAFAGFLTDTIGEDGEMPVVMVDQSGETTDYSNFEEFLEEQLAFYEDVVEGEKADRKDLEDD